MAAALIWTKSRDNLLIELRAEGRSWDSIAAMLGLGRWAAIQRGRLVGACKPESPPAQRDTGPTGRDALPAGHPITWGAITAGTLLADMAYPIPPLVERRDAAAADAPVVEWAA